MHETGPRKNLGSGPPPPAMSRAPLLRRWADPRSGPGGDGVEIAVQGLGVPVASHFENFSPTIRGPDDPPLVEGQVRQEIGVFLLTGSEILIREILKAQEIPKTARPDELTLALEAFGIFPEEPPRLGVIL